MPASAPQKSSSNPATAFWVALTAVWSALIFFSSTSRGGTMGLRTFSRYYGEWLASHPARRGSYPAVEFLAEKGFHAVLFTIFGIILWNAFPRAHRSAGNVLTAGATVGVCSEVLQMFFVTRDPTIRDALINAAGTALGVGLCLLVGKMKGHKTSGV